VPKANGTDKAREKDKKPLKTLEEVVVEKGEKAMEGN